LATLRRFQFEWSHSNKKKSLKIKKAGALSIRKSRAAFAEHAGPAGAAIASLEIDARILNW
jgi:hypothetical protein